MKIELFGRDLYEIMIKYDEQVVATVGGFGSDLINLLQVRVGPKTKIEIRPAFCGNDYDAAFSLHFLLGDKTNTSIISITKPQSYWRAICEMHFRRKCESFYLNQDLDLVFEFLE